MANMGYCRFQNTLSDLRDCVLHLNDELTPKEHEARKRLIITAKQIVAMAKSGEVPDKPATDA